MKRIGVKLIALLLSLMMVMTLPSCSILSRIFSNDDDTGRSSRDKDDDEDDDDGDDDDGEGDKHGSKDPDGKTPGRSDRGDLEPLTYPDHVATLDEVHPSRNPGVVSGTAASNLLDEIERELIVHYVSSYVDIELCFEHPENYGLSTDEVSWGSLEYDSDAEMAFVDQELAKLYTINRDSLDRDDMIFYDKAVWDLEETKYSSQYSAFSYYQSVFNPLTGPQCDVLFVLDLMKFDDVQDAENYLLLLNDLDRYYDGLCQFEEDKASYGYALTDSIYEQIGESFDNLVEMEDDCFLYETFEERLDNIHGLSNAQRQDLISRHEDMMHDVVFPEFQECADRMRALVGSGGNSQGICQYEGADAYYAALCRSKSNSGKTVEELKNDLEDVIASVMRTYNSIINGSSSWYLGYLTHDYSVGDTQANLNFLKNKVAADFPALHDHSYQLMTVPEVFEENFSPAAFLGYHLDNYDSNQIIVNQGSTEDDLGVTIAHEGYPGHLLQSVYTRGATDHPYLYLFDSIGYAEGWSMYAETYAMRYYDSDNTVRTLVQIEDELNVLFMARCDIGINWEGWDLDDCASFFSAQLGRSIKASSLQDMYDLLYYEPCYAVKYGCGFVNTGLIIQAAHDSFPDATELEIHTAYLNALTGTFEQIRENMFAELQG